MKPLIFISFFIAFTPFAFSQTREIKYYDNGKAKLEGFVKNNTYDSTFISYYENGNKQSEGTYKKVTYKTSSMGIVQATCGTGRDTTEPAEGIRNGQWMYYYPNGQLKSISSYFGNIQVGQSKFYDTTGNLLENEFYSWSFNTKTRIFWKWNFREIHNKNLRRNKE